MQKITNPKARRNLKIAEIIKNNVNNSDPEIALYLLNALQELGETPDDLARLQEISASQDIRDNEIISKNIELIRCKLKNKNSVNNKPSNNNNSNASHLRGYLGAAFMVLVIFSIIHFYVQSEKIKRDSTLLLKFSAWKASYFCNNKLEGEPCFSETKDQINVDWKGNPPAANVTADQFSAKFESCIALENRPQEVYFSLGADDGYRLSIDGELVKDSWQIQGFEAKTFAYTIPEGKHLLKLEYYQSGGASRIEIKAGSHRTNIADIKVDKNILYADCQKTPN